jgi:hypothetical protein
MPLADPGSRSRGAVQVDSSAAFRFNDELLLAPEDRDLARRSFPDIYFALDHPALRADFEKLDGEARKAKSRSRTFGLAAIGLALLSLLTFPLEPLFRFMSAATTTDPGVLRALALAGAASGLLAIVFGNIGLGFGASKRAWLYKRLACERLRQWHAQYLLATAVDIAAAVQDPERRKAYEAERAIAYQRFQRGFLGQIPSEFTKHTQRNAAGRVSSRALSARDMHSFWIDPGWASLAARKPAASDASALTTLRSAYVATRLQGQIQYTNYTLSESGKFWSHPARQIRILGTAAFAFIVLAFLVNFVAMGLTIARVPTSLDLALVSLAMALAILAVGARALQEGLHPHQEMSRMEAYAGAVANAQHEIDAAKGPHHALIAAQLLERAATEEMIDFLITNDRARFVL